MCARDTLDVFGLKNSHDKKMFSYPPEQSPGAAGSESTMNASTDLGEVIEDLLRQILQVYNERVPERGKFNDVRAGAPVHFGDPRTTRPGRIELAVMHMDTEIDRNYDEIRFLAVRVWKSREGGIASSTCFHAPKASLKAQLEEEVSAPHFLVDRVEELAHGLPEETNPDIWR